MMDSEDSHNPVKDSLYLLARATFPYESKHTALGSGSNFFKSAEWSPDGTSVVTNSADNHIRTVIVPPNLLENREEPLQLQSYSTITSFEPVNALACFPSYDLQDPATTLILSTASEHPIRLNSALDGRLVASYPLVSSTTEAYIKPQSLLFTSGGGHFLAGSENSIATFDVSRTGQEPLSSFRTGPKNSKASWSNPATSLRGLISALAIDNQYNVLAAGTLARGVGLYDSTGQGDCIGTFSVAGNAADEVISGSGITQAFWSKCGRYLHIVERKSDGFMIYDIRKTGQLLSWTVGRNAKSNQRMKVELATDKTTDAQYIWAGGTDGMIRQWASPHLQEGSVEPLHSLSAHSDSVNSISIHDRGDVLATASGQRAFPDLDRLHDPDSIHKSNTDNTLKLWQHKSNTSNS